MLADFLKGSMLNLNIGPLNNISTILSPDLVFRCFYY